MATAFDDVPPWLDVAADWLDVAAAGLDVGAAGLDVAGLTVATLVALAGVAALGWCVVVQPVNATAAIASRAEALEKFTVVSAQPPAIATTSPSERTCS
ncbi:MAG: hypothetical protein QOG69_1182 [Actinomycetota bacterium]|nr:hypothetical protein [Actinomycetota bacterium]